MTVYELYYDPGRLSAVVHWILIVLAKSSDVEYKLHLTQVASAANRTPQFLELNPLGRVPTLIVDGQPVTESVAILLLLTERHPEAGLAPPIGSLHRAKFLETMILLANVLLPAVRDLFYAAADGAPGAVSEVKAMASRRTEKAWSILDQRLDGQEYILPGDQPTVADFLLVFCARWNRNQQGQGNPSTWKNIMRLVTTMTVRDDYKALLEKEEFAPWP